MRLIFDGDRMHIEQVSPDKLLVAFVQNHDPRNSVVFKSADGDRLLEPLEGSGPWPIYELFRSPGQPSWGNHEAIGWDFVITDGVRVHPLSFNFAAGEHSNCILKTGDLTIDLDLGPDFWGADYDRFARRHHPNPQDSLRFAPRAEMPPEVQPTSFWDRLKGV